jgi:membrane-associated protein
MDYLRQLFVLVFDLLRHLGEDAKWKALIDHVGQPTVAGILFLIIFIETGLVIWPFLPGDSLLFAIGAIGAREGAGLDPWFLAVLLSIAAVLGDAVNYWAGYIIGPRVFKSETSKLLNKKHLLRAQEFYNKYGGKTIILARFVPIVRTFAPFVAGIGKMNYFRFFLYNVVGGVAWVVICIGAGVLFGSHPFVKKNFELVIVAIVVISVIPMVVEFVRAKMAAKRGGSAVVEATTIGRSEP